MKTIFTIIFLSFFTNVSFAQYQSLFGTESTSWDMSEWDVGIFGEHPYLQVYYASIDTLINGHIYKKISPGYVPPYDDLYASYLREDTIEGKAWSINRMDSPTEQEFLIMDLSLEVGDTFAISDGTHYPDVFFDLIVDSVYYDEGRKHIRFNFDIFTGEPFTMIEGVGTNIGTFYQPYSYITLYYTLCQSKDDTQSYVNNSPYFLGRCDVSAVAVNEVKKPEYQLNIFPNPTSDQTIIDLPNEPVIDKNKGIPLKLMDVSGRIMMSEKVTSFPYKLDASSLTAGVYLVLVGDIAIGKFLKD